MQRRVLVRDVNYFGYMVEFVIWIIQYGNETSNGDFVVQGNLQVDRYLIHWSALW